MTKKYKHLVLEERILIQTQLKLGLRPIEIAKSLNRPRSCITRELKRNNWQPPTAGGRRAGRPLSSGGYTSVDANTRAKCLASTPRIARKLQIGNALWEKVKASLRNGLSPEQIAGTLKRMEAPQRLCHETIYKAIYLMPKGELRKEMIGLLRFAHNKRRPRSRGIDRRGQIPAMISIDQRPAEVAGRLVPGHWEGDHIKGRGNASQVGTLVERRSLFVTLVKLDNGTAQETARGFSAVLQRFDQSLRRSLTYDQGKEMAQHVQLSADIGIAVYFAHPHSPWERGRNENTNGLLRQYLPKGEDLSIHSQAELDDIAWRLNTRPRKSLGWLCPAELFLPAGAFDFKAYWRHKFDHHLIESQAIQ
jgi:IS30 family transposase